MQVNLQLKIELIMNELKVTFYLKKNETRADGYVPVLGRIRIGKSMVQFSAKVYVQEKLWDVQSGRAKGKSRAAVIKVNSPYRLILRISISTPTKALLISSSVIGFGTANARNCLALEQATYIIRCLSVMI